MLRHGFLALSTVLAWLATNSETRIPVTGNTLSILMAQYVDTSSLVAARPVMFSTKSLATRVAGGSGGLASVSRACQLLGARTLRVSTPARDIRTDGGGEAEDFIERSLDQASKQGAKKRDLTPGEVLTTKREALSLYRAVWRASFMFVWKNERGLEWKEVIRESARKEFEAARHERDPEMVARLLLTGRDYLDQAMQKFLEKRQKIIDAEESKDAGGPPRGVPSAS